MRLMSPFAVVHLSLALCVRAANTTGLLSIPPSLYWDGADGSWSSFQIQIGTPAQTVRLLPGTSANAGNSIWAVIPEGCSAAVNTNFSNCGSERGYLFARNESTTWSTQRLQNGGLYQLDTFEESVLGLTGNAYYGFDTVQLGLPGAGLPNLTNQIVAGFATTSFWLGSLGLSPVPFNFTNLNDPLPSLLGTLRSQNYIASSSWAYTAGAVYQDPPVFGSLTLGGYDNARLNSSASLTAIPFGAEFSRDLVVGIQSITYDTIGSSPLLSTGVYAFIDSMVTAMWLPVSACQAFEKAFNLTWNATAELYTLTDDQHSALLAQNPTFSIKLGQQASAGGSTIDITLPYAAFDLNISQPYVDQQTRYFPLQRAQNSSQYTLGRVFLQEAYVIADYDRQQFQVAQALFPSSGTGQKLAVIEPPGFSSSTPTPVPGPTAGLSVGAIVGIVIGAIVLLALVAGVVVFLVRRRRKNARTTKEAAIPDPPHDTASSDEKTLPAELAPNKTDPYAEVSSDQAIHEIGGNKVFSELSSESKAGKYELPAGSESKVEKYELPAGSVAQEKDGQSIMRTDPVELE